MGNWETWQPMSCFLETLKMMSYQLWKTKKFLGNFSETYRNLLTTAKFIIQILVSFRVSRFFKFMETNENQWKPESFFAQLLMKGVMGPEKGGP